MKRRLILLLGALFAVCDGRAAGNTRVAKPNIILILADDLGYAELGCYGQKKIRTPAINRLAAEGMRFTQHYASCAVCAPSRCGLLTGRHLGHAYIRDNRERQPEGQEPIPETTVTIAKLLQSAGYTTAAIGKWGLGPPGSDGDPLKQGFDLFYGYNCQRHAHNYYPAYLWHNHDKVKLKGNTGDATGAQYSPDLMEAEALRFIRESTVHSTGSGQPHPFFLYFASTLPHVAIQTPEELLAPYLGKWDDPPYDGSNGYRPHPHPHAGYAAMVSRLDTSVARIVQLLKQLKLEGNTIVIFSSDNGPTHGRVGGADSKFFASAGPLRGLKGSLFEGGIRVPFIARWRGKIPRGVTSDLPCVSYDLLPTLCQLAGVEIPSGTDGVSFLPTLLGNRDQKRHDFLYWEFPGYGGQQAVRLGDWKAVRQQMDKGNTRIELFNLFRDLGEKNNVAARHPDIVERVTQLMREQHQPSALFPIRALDNPEP